jgi:hypothetical protein
MLRPGKIGRKQSPLPAILDSRRSRRVFAGRERLFLFRGGTGWRSAAKLRTKDEARRTAVNVAKLPELLRCAIANDAGESRKPVNQLRRRDWPEGGRYE